MLDYQEFCEKVKNELLENMSEFFREGFSVAIANISHEGKKLNVLTVESSLLEYANVKTPSIVIQGLYDWYKKNGGNFEYTIKDLALKYEQKYRNAPLEEKNAEGKSVVIDLEKVFFQACNKDLCGERLEELPYIDKGSVVLVFNQLIEKKEDEIVSCVINNNSLSDSGYTLSDLEKVAIVNTAKFFPAEITNVADNLYLISNSDYIFGSSVLFYENNPLTKLSEQLNKTLVVIPESKDYVLVDCVEKINAEDYQAYVDFLQTIGEESEEPVLADTVFVFSAETKELDMKPFTEEIVPTINEVRTVTRSL